MGLLELHYRVVRGMSELLRSSRSMKDNKHGVPGSQESVSRAANADNQDGC